MENKKRKFTAQEIKEFKSNDMGPCSGCGDELSSWNVSNDGGTCTDCYKKEN